jgi:hypothetical protein
MVESRTIAPWEVLSLGQLDVDLTDPGGGDPTASRGSP